MNTTAARDARDVPRAIGAVNIANGATIGPAGTNGCHSSSSVFRRWGLPQTIRLVHPWAAAALLDRPALTVLRMVEDGRLLWGFNLAIGQSARLLRILGRSVEDVLEGRHGDRAFGGDEDFEAVAEWIWPAERGEMRANELAQAWSCDTDHVLALARNGLLRTRSRCRCGPGGSPVIDRGSAMEFLRGRRAM